MVLLRGISRSFASCAKRLQKTPLEEYERLVELGKLKNDVHQKKILSNLSVLHKSLTKYTPPDIHIPTVEDLVKEQKGKSSFFGRVFSSKKPQREAKDFSDQEFEKIPMGLYLWGDVGCGKTMLMDLFYNTIPGHLTKKRIHFHQFMQNLHKRSHQIIMQHGKSDLDPMPIMAGEIAAKSTVLCFDEFQVTDVADAMLLRRFLMTTLAPTHGMVLFATSNREPNDLYINGVQRESFIPAIELLERRTNVVYLSSPTDYRRIAKPLSTVYYAPPHGTKYKDTVSERQKHVNQWFEYFAQGSSSVADATIKIWGRDLHVPKSSSGKVAQFSFDELCGQPLAAGDYLALATHYRAFIVTDIPYLTVNVRDKVRRFITFLDAAYDNQCKLATTGANGFNNLFVDLELVDPEDSFELKEGVQDKVEDYNKHSGGSANAYAEKIKDELGLVDEKLIHQSTQLFAMDEERFAFVRALSRLTHMSTVDWVEQ